MLHGFQQEHIKKLMAKNFPLHTIFSLVYCKEYSLPTTETYVDQFIACSVAHFSNLASTIMAAISIAW